MKLVRVKSPFVVPSELFFCVDKKEQVECLSQLGGYRHAQSPISALIACRRSDDKDVQAKQQREQ